MSEREYTITLTMLKYFDELYEDSEPYGSPAGRWHRMWGVLVEELRSIRRLIQAGVTVKVEGTETVFTEWCGFSTNGVTGAITCLKMALTNG